MPTQPPFGLAPVIPAFDRATRLACTLFDAAGANVVLIQDEHVWRSGDPGGTWTRRADTAMLAMQTGELLWIEDLKSDRRFNLPKIEGRPLQVGLYAAAPVRLSDGLLPGVLMVYDHRPKAHDPALAARLMDLADSVADECDRARTRDRAERAEQRLQIALELADIYVTDIDYQRGVLETAGARNVFKAITYEEVVRDGFSPIDERDRDRVVEAWRQHLRTGAPYRPEYRVPQDNGREVWAITQSRAFRDGNGRVTRVVAASQDITWRKESELALLKAKEEAEVANRAKSTFLATMSHEIRTPLNGVLGMAQAMAMHPLSPDQRRRLDVIQRSGETLLAILNDVLDLSKIEAGKLALETGEIDVEELAGGVHAIFAPTARTKGCAFVLTVAPEAAGVYAGDPTRVRQILYNLVSNALKFTEAGEVRVSVGAAPGGLELQVADTGVGIQPDQMALLFRKFEQADASTTRRFGGTGLGLAICRELAQLMGGEIRAESEPGKGATFTVVLPLPRLRRRKARKPAAAPAQAAQPRCGARRVLAAEDNEVNRQVLAALLQPMGVELRFAETGAQAVAAWEAEAWDVILMDVHMPQMDGPTATRAIRAREAETGRPRTPIVALTANAMAHQVDSYAACGMDGFIAKPIEVGRLYEALEAALAGRPPAPRRAAAGV
jgi:signal transduction histidine kinase/ActR/RegA family two-component response regulator